MMMVMIIDHHFHRDYVVTLAHFPPLNIARDHKNRPLSTRCNENKDAPYDGGSRVMAWLFCK